MLWRGLRKYVSLEIKFFSEFNCCWRFVYVFLFLLIVNWIFFNFNFVRIILVILELDIIRFLVLLMLVLIREIIILVLNVKGVVIRFVMDKILLMVFKFVFVMVVIFIFLWCLCRFDVSFFSCFLVRRFFGIYWMKVLFSFFCNWCNFLNFLVIWFIIIDFWGSGKSTLLLLFFVFEELL